MLDPGQITLAALIERVQRHLRSVGHPASREIAVAALALLSGLHDRSARCVRQWNELVDFTHKADLSFWILFPVPARDFRTVKIRNINYGRLNLDRLQYRLRVAKAGLPYDLQQLAGNLALEREPYPTTLINWQEAPCLARHLALAVSQEEEFVRTVLLDDFYAAVMDLLFDHIVLDELREAQLLLEALGKSFLSETVASDAPMTRRVGLFLWDLPRAGRGGWVTLCQANAITWNFVGFDSHFERERNELERQFGRWHLLDLPGDQTVVSFCRFLQRARRHLEAGRRDEALLHGIIALDLSFGLEGNSASCVADRAAVVTHCAAGKTLEEQRARLKALYDARSKYVHEGRPTTEKQCEDALEICVQVLCAMLRRAKTVPPSTGDWLKQWHQQLDYLESAVRAGKKIDPQEWMSAGVEQVGTKPNG